MTLTRVRGPSGTVAVDDGGSGGLPVVFLHSLAGNAAHWQAQLDRLRGSRRAIAVELRGHGRSDPPGNGDYRLPSLAGDLEAAVDALGLERFALAGHSLGGGVAVAYAGAHPERVERLFLLDATGDGTRLPAAEVEPFLAALQSAYGETIERYWETIVGPDPAVRKRLFRDLRALPRETVVAVMRASARFAPGPALAAYPGPAFAVVTPANDQPFSLHRIGRGFPHRIIEGTGHWIQLDRPAEVSRILEGFLSS